MTQSDAIRLAFHDQSPVPPSRREIRALRARAKALSPVRILLSLLMVPVATTMLTVAIYIRASTYEPQDALRHLIALTGCGAAAKLGMTDMALGQVGYHPRNDADGNGVSCESGQASGSRYLDEYVSQPQARAQPVRGAKFLRP